MGIGRAIALVEEVRCLVCGPRIAAKEFAAVRVHPLGIFQLPEQLHFVQRHVPQSQRFVVFFISTSIIRPDLVPAFTSITHGSRFSLQVELDLTILRLPDGPRGTEA